MPSKKKLAPTQTPAVEAAQPVITPLTITRNGKTVEYKLQLEYRSFVLAEQKTRHLGVTYSLLDTLKWDDPSPAQMQRLLFAALQKHHPEMKYEEAAAIVDLRNFADVHRALASCYIVAVRDEV